MMGEATHSTPVIQVPPWSPVYEESPEMGSSLPVSGISPTGGGADYSGLLLGEAFTALQRYLPSNELQDGDEPEHDSGVPVDAYSCDEFRMYEFKVRRCTRGRSHDWTECPYAHPGEKARRRDPRRYHYSGTACPEFRKGSCRRGDACEYAHGVFECWLHPARYRTQPCKDGTCCRRRVCFFAHTPEQLRVLPGGHHHHASPRAGAAADSYDGSPLRHHSLDAYFSKLVLSSPTSTLISPPLSPPSESPPQSPIRRHANGGPVNEVLASLRQLQLSKAQSVAGGFGSPRGGTTSLLRQGSVSLPATPTTPARGAWFELWDRGCVEEPTMERVESGRGLRAQIYEKLSKENAAEAGPDVGWISELVM